MRAMALFVPLFVTIPFALPTYTNAQCSSGAAPTCSEACAPGDAPDLIRCICGEPNAQDIDACYDRSQFDISDEIPTCDLVCANAGSGPADAVATSLNWPSCVAAAGTCQAGTAATACGCSELAMVPTLSEWGVVGMAALMLSGVLYLRRRASSQI